MISLPQIQIACDRCRKKVEVEIEQVYIDGSEFTFDADEWLAENGWHRLEDKEIACPRHRASTEATNGTE